MPSFDLHGARIEFLDGGAGEPVILLHCSASSSEQWRALAERLARSYRVLAPDFYGCGASDRWREGAFCLANEAEIVYALLRRAGSRAHLIGHSYGGAVALQAALRRGAAVRSLTLIEPVAFHVLREANGVDAALYDEVSAVGRRIIRAHADGLRETGMEAFVDFWNGAGAWAAIPAEKRGPLCARLDKLVLDYEAVSEEATRLHDFWPLFMPALILQGSASPLAVRRICSQLSRVLPEVRHEVIEGAGHMLPLTHAAVVNERIVAHLDKVRRQQSFQFAA
ncbi:MAG TPA: alpha/beta hydrolase [Burkholderiales bacterium]